MNDLTKRIKDKRITEAEQRIVNLEAEKQEIMTRLSDHIAKLDEKIEEEKVVIEAFNKLR